MTIRIENHLIVPFGRLDCDSQRVRIVGNFTRDLVLESETPCVHINRTTRKGVTLEQLRSAVAVPDTLCLDNDVPDFLNTLCDMLRNSCELQGSHEHLFLMLYFEQLAHIYGFGASAAADKSSLSTILSNALMPLPKAHFHLSDFSSSVSRDHQRQCITIDFAFWTGRRFLAVFVGDSGVENHSLDEKLLRFWGVDTFRVSPRQLETIGLKDFWPEFRDAQIFDTVNRYERMLR
jgi:hypothetical protein